MVDYISFEYRVTLRSNALFFLVVQIAIDLQVNRFGRQNRD